jgi:hypothetical protein
VPCPQVHYRLAVDGDRHRRADLAVPSEVLGKRFANVPEARITPAVHGKITGSLAHYRPRHP